MRRILANVWRYLAVSMNCSPAVAFGAQRRYEKGAQSGWSKAQQEAGMRADQVEVSWDGGKSKWLVRIVNGEEVIRRYCNLPKDADERTLGAAAQKTVQGEGYEGDLGLVSVRR